ncbi:MAG: Zn-dependent alcohol dehydrogenase [Thermodesulfobacteriota bacterium]|nr:Zn-dependent alcohol dehydrogenase [Thermodesulfobacteriota bacterium]
MKAAILYEINKPLVIEEIPIPQPKDNELLVKIAATGVCHTDLHPIKGDMPVPLPIVLGHEGAGIVEKTGKGVKNLKEGDHVILSVMPYCGDCFGCLMGKPYLCSTAWPTIFGGTMIDGTKRLSKENGAELNHFFGQSSFAEYAVVDERSAIKIREDAPLDKVAVFGCGATTGIGTIVNTAKVEAGARIVIFGCGGVGLSAIMAARMVGAGLIIAVDIMESKLKMAQEFGAHIAINSSMENPVERILEITNGGADYTFEFIGNVNVMEQAYNSSRPGGLTVIVGSPPAGEKLSIDPMGLLTEKTIMGTAGGSLRPGIDIPRYVELYMQKKLDLDKLITKSFPLEDINRSFETMEKGEVGRSVIVF